MLLLLLSKRCEPIGGATVMSIDLLSNLIITRVNAVSTMYTPEHKKSEKKDRSCWAVYIKYEGETIYRSKGKEYLSDRDHIVVLPRGSQYEWQCTKAGHFSVIEFDSEICAEEPMCIHVKNSEKLLAMFKDLEHKRDLRKPMYEMECIRDVYTIILYLAQHGADHYTPSYKQRKLFPVLEYISQNYNKRITNDMLACVAGMSTVYFRKLFTEVMGESPIAYIKRFRIEKAKEMLGSDYASVSDVAQSLGYSSLYDFSRDFKKHTGGPPSKYQL